MGLTGFVIIHVLIASFSPAQGERNQIVNTKFTRPVNEMPMSSSDIKIVFVSIDFAIKSGLQLQMVRIPRWALAEGSSSESCEYAAYVGDRGRVPFGSDTVCGGPR